MANSALMCHLLQTGLNSLSLQSLDQVVIAMIMWKYKVLPNSGTLNNKYLFSSEACGLMIYAGKFLWSHLGLLIYLGVIQSVG